MIELRFIKIGIKCGDECRTEIRLQQRDGFKQVDGDVTTECIWADIPIWDEEKQELKPTFDLTKLAKELNLEF